MADLKSKHGFERAQFRGRASVQIQALLTAAVINVKQLMKRVPEVQGGWVMPPQAARTGLFEALLVDLAAFLRHRWSVQAPKPALV